MDYAAFSIDDEDVIIIVPDEDSHSDTETLLDNGSNDDLDYRNYMVLFMRMFGSHFVLNTGEARIRAWFNALTNIQREAWRLVNVAFTQRFTALPSARPAPREMPDLLAAPTVQPPTNEAPLRAGHARRGRAHPYRMPNNRRSFQRR